MGKKTKKKAAKTTPRMPSAARPGTAQGASNIVDAQNILDKGGKVRLTTTKVAVLREACKKQRSDAVWKNFVTVWVKNASKIEVITAAIEEKISPDKISFQSADPELVKEARKYLPRERAKLKSAKGEKRKIAAEMLGADAIATPVVCSAETLKEALKESALRRVDVQVSSAEELEEVLKIKDRDPRVGRVNVQVSSTAELVKVLAVLPSAKTRDERLGRVDVQVSNAAELKKVLVIKTRDPRVGRVEVNVTSAAELEKVLAIRDERLGRISAQGLSSEAEARLVLAIKARNPGRVGNVTVVTTSAAQVEKAKALPGLSRVAAAKVSRATEAEKAVTFGADHVAATLSTAAEAAATAALDGVDRTTVLTGDVSEAQQAAAMESVARSVVRSIRQDVVEAAEAAGLDVYVHAPDADKRRVTEKARRAAYREVLRDASVRGKPDRRSGFAKMQACWRQIRRLRGVLRRFFDDRAADEARKPWVCEVGVGAKDRVWPLPDKLLPLHDETTAWLNRIESVLRLADGARFSKKMLERLITEGAMVIHRGAADGDFPCRNHPTTPAPSESSKATRPY